MATAPNEGNKRTIGVIIPTYNRAHLLPATLDAILDQTRIADEILVVDDGSTDETPAVLSGYGGRLRAIRVVNSGDLAARNVGLRNLATDLVAFCDSDDIWMPGFLETMERIWQSEPGTRVAYGNFVILRNGIWETEDKFSAAPPGFWNGLRPLGPDIAVFDSPVFPRLIAYQPFFPSAMMIDRDFFLEIGGWDEVVSNIVGSDFATALRINQHAPLGILTKPLIGIRKHAGNFSGDVQKMNLGDALILEHALRTSPALAPYRALIHASVCQRRRAALDSAFAARDFSAVNEIFSLLPPANRGGSARLKAIVATLGRIFG